MVELLGLFAVSFAAATLLPMPSEAALYGYLMRHPDDAVLAVTTATLGNTAGGMTTYLIGRLLPQRMKFNERALQWIRRWGAAATFFAWLPDRSLLERSPPDRSSADCSPPDRPPPPRRGSLRAKDTARLNVITITEPSNLWDMFVFSFMRRASSIDGIFDSGKLCCGLRITAHRRAV